MADGPRFVERGEIHGQLHAGSISCRYPQPDESRRIWLRETAGADAILRMRATSSWPRLVAFHALSPQRSLVFTGPIFKADIRNLVGGVAPSDVRWISILLAQLSQPQWKDIFRAGGFSDSDAVRHISRLRAKIADGRRAG